METESVPARFLADQSSDNHVVFVPYLSSAPLVKGRASLDRHMISLITEGEKVVHIENKTIHLTPDQILLLAAGNVLFTERLGKNASIKSTMIFFDDHALYRALDQFDEYHQCQSKNNSYIVVDRDDYLRNFIESVNALVEQGLLSGPLQYVKFNELLAYLNSRYPDLLSGFCSASARPEEERLRQVMEAH
jgi:hypothetical protein